MKEEKEKINANKMNCIKRYVDSDLSENEMEISFNKFMKYVYVNRIYLNKNEIVFLLNTSEKLYKIIGHYCQNNAYDNVDNKLVKKFMKYYELIRNFNLISQIPEMKANNKTYDEVEINGIDVYYDSLPEKILSRDEVNALCNLIEKGNVAARDKLIGYNLRLVVSIAKKYIGCGIDFDDLISSGNEGLTIAADKYNYRLGFTFATYATFRIVQCITRNIAENSRTVRVPVYLHERLTKIKAFMNKYYSQNMRFPDSDIIANALNLTEEQVEEALPLLQSIISLDYANTENADMGDEPIINFIPDENNNIEDEEDKIFYEQIKEIIFNQGNLNAKEKEILAYRYGFVDDRKYTLEELGDKLGITKERVRQIEAKTLEKLSQNRNLRFINSERIK